MKPSEIIKKPVVTEKINKQTEKFNRYCFVVDKRANKLEIKKAVEEFYSVRVENVNTCVVPAKAKSRMTKAGILRKIELLPGSFRIRRDDLDSIVAGEACGGDNV